MGLLRAHIAAVSAVAVALIATGGVFAFAKPQYHPYSMPAPPGDGLTYTAPTYGLAQARRAFAAHGVRLLRGGRTPGIADLHSADGVVEVSVFGDRRTVDASGFSDYYTFANGRWELAPKSCLPGAKNAERWNANVRLIVRCDAAGLLPSAT